MRMISFFEQKIARLCAVDYVIRTMVQVCHWL